MQFRRIRRGAITLALALVAAGVVAGPASARVGETHKAEGTTVTRVTVNMFEYRFRFSRASAPKGVVIFRLRNTGDEVHDVSFVSFKKSPFVAAKSSATWRVRFPKARRFQAICTVGEHLYRGMKATFRVT